MPATNIRLIIQDHAQDTLDELNAEQDKLMSRLYEIQDEISRVTLHQRIEANRAAARSNGAPKSGESHSD